MYVVSWIVVLNLFFFPLCAHSVEPLLHSLDESSAALGNYEIAMTPEGVRIHVRERTLQEVLQHIHHINGIRFSISPILKSAQITATINTPDWPTAIQQLLRSFNTIETWDDGGNQLRRVSILGYGQGQTTPSEQAHNLEHDDKRIEILDLPELPPADSLPPVPPPPSPPTP